MKKILLLLALSTLACISCKSNKDYLQRSDEDKALQEAVKKLNKEPNDTEASIALPILYKNISTLRLARIKSLENSREINRWDRIISEYNQLQSAYNSIINSTAAFKLVTPENYGTQLMETKEKAAADYYDLAESYFVKAGRDNAKKAFSNYKKAAGYVANYKDATAKMNQAKENAIVDVVINPVQDNSFFYNNGWGNSWTGYSNDYFQRTLVRDLDYNSGNNSRYAARFYSDWEVRNKNIKPDWEVNLTLRNMDIPIPQRYNYSNNRSKQIEIGKDTSGRPIYQTVTATVRITRYSFTAYASMDVQIKDIVTPKSISNRNFREDYRWQEESGTYSGDSRALTNSDWNAINNGSFREPQREQVVEELYRKLYSSILSHIRTTVEW
ncbi:MAG TPA: hypothetical protein PK504_10170 [Ferruginibacter sp.]|nr:hypothetical protein [Ferruginibacter sp.]HRE63508.1 hypothetical protein [Ferruginibacter sp.]